MSGAFGTNWLDLSSTSNRYIQTYYKGFVDISGGPLYVRNNNLFVQGGDVSLNGRLYVSVDASLNGNVFIGKDLSLNGRLFVGADASFGGNLYSKTTNYSTFPIIDVSGTANAPSLATLTGYTLVNYTGAQGHWLPQCMNNNGIGYSFVETADATTIKKLFKTVNGGKTWTYLTNQSTLLSSTYSFRLDQGQKTLLTDATGQFVMYLPNGYTWISRNGGTTWSQMSTSSALTTTGFTAVIPTNSTGLIYAISDGLYKSTDFAVTWTKTTYATNPNVYGGIATSADGKYIYTANNYNGLWASTDYGATGSVIYSLGSGNRINYFCECSDDGKYVLLAGRTDGPVTTPTVYVSSNFGVSFTAVTVSTSTSSSVPYVSTTGQYMIVTPFFSSNYGVTWTSITANTNGNMYGLSKNFAYSSVLVPNNGLRYYNASFYNYNNNIGYLNITPIASSSWKEYSAINSLVEINGDNNGVSLYTSGSTIIGGDASLNRRFFVGADASFGGNITASGKVSGNALNINNDLTYEQLTSIPTYFSLSNWSSNTYTFNGITFTGYLSSVSNSGSFIMLLLYTQSGTYTAANIVYSKDFGATWSNGTFPGTNITFLSYITQFQAYGTQYAFLGLRYDNVSYRQYAATYRSTDAGVTWTPWIANGQTVMPQFPFGTGYFGFTNGQPKWGVDGVSYYTDDGKYGVWSSRYDFLTTSTYGETWNKISIPNPGYGSVGLYNYWASSKSGQYLLAGYWSPSANGGNNQGSILLSTNYGATFSTISNFGMTQSASYPFANTVSNANGHPNVWGGGNWFVTTVAMNSTGQIMVVGLYFENALSTNPSNQRQDGLGNAVSGLAISRNYGTSFTYIPRSTFPNIALTTNVVLVTMNDVFILVNDQTSAFYYISYDNGITWSTTQGVSTWTSNPTTSYRNSMFGITGSTTNSITYSINKFTYGNSTAVYMSNSYLGLGTTSPSYILDVSGVPRFSGQSIFQSDVSINNRLYVGSDVSFGGKLFTNGDVSLNNRLYVAWDVSINGNFYVGKNVGIAKVPTYPLDISGISRTSGAVIFGTLPTTKYYNFSRTPSTATITSPALTFTFGNSSFYAKFNCFLSDASTNTVSSVIFDVQGGNAAGTTPTNNIAEITRVSTINGFYRWLAPTYTATTVVLGTTANTGVVANYSVRVELIQTNAVAANVPTLNSITMVNDNLGGTVVTNFAY